MSEETTKIASLEDTVNFIRENGKKKPNGVRELPKAAFYESMARHGVTKEDYEAVQTAVDLHLTAAAEVASLDLADDVTSASKDDLANAQFRKDLSSTVRIPTFNGSTEVSCIGEKIDFNQMKKDADGNPERVVKHGVFRVKINTKSRIQPAARDVASDRIRKLLAAD